MTLDQFQKELEIISKQGPGPKNSSYTRWLKQAEALVNEVPVINIELPGTSIQKRNAWKLNFHKGSELLSKSTLDNLKKINLQLNGVKWDVVYISPRVQYGNGFGNSKVVYSFTIFGVTKRGVKIALDRRESPSVGGGTTLVCIDGQKPEKITYWLNEYKMHLTPDQKQLVKEYIQTLKSKKLNEGDKPVRNVKEIVRISAEINKKFNKKYDAGYGVEMDPPAYGGTEHAMITIKSSTRKIDEELIRFLKSIGYGLSPWTYSSRVGGYRIKCRLVKIDK